MHIRPNCVRVQSVRAPQCPGVHARADGQSSDLLRMRITRYQLLLTVTFGLALVVLLSTMGTTRWVLLSLLFAACSSLAGLGVSFPQWQMFGPSLCQVRTAERVVALTFDDGPDPVNTPALLDLLARKRARASFFCVGYKVARHTEVAQRIAAEGHLIGNHSFAHSYWTNCFGEARLRADLERAQSEIARVTGATPKYFRPPMTLTNQRVFRVVRALSLTVAGYSIRGYDRGNADGQRVLTRMLRRMHPGAIILMHDGGVPVERLLTLVEGLVDQLQVQGYRCLRLDELAACGAAA